MNIAGLENITDKYISQEELLTLIKDSQNGNLEARDLVVKSNLKLVLSVIKKNNNNMGVSEEELVQEGLKGLLKAIDDFDFSQDVRFSTYAIPKIIGEIRRYLSSKIPLPRPMKDIAYKALYYKKRYLQQNHKNPSIEEIALELNVDIIDVIKALEAIQEYMPLINNNEETCLTNTIREGLSKLDEQLRKIIEERCFNGKTQKEVALELGISQSQVSKLEKEALKIVFDEN